MKWEEERDAKQRKSWSSDGDIEKPGIERRRGKRRENDEREKVEKESLWWIIEKKREVFNERERFIIGNEGNIH